MHKATRHERPGKPHRSQAELRRLNEKGEKIRELVRQYDEGVITNGQLVTKIEAL
jgi:hypothetical protein